MFNEPDDAEIRDAAAPLPAVSRRVFPRDRRAQGLSRAVRRCVDRGQWLSAMIPEAYGGTGLGLTAASVIMEEINRSGGNAGAARADVQHGNAAAQGQRSQKEKSLAGHRRRKTAHPVDGRHEPTTGSDTTKIRTTAVKRDGRYVVNGQKVWISRVQHSDLMILGADHAARGGEEEIRGHVDLHRRPARGHRRDLTVKPIANLVNHETNELFFDNLERSPRRTSSARRVRVQYILDGLNAERTLIAAECIGDGYWFVERARRNTRAARRLRSPHRSGTGVAPSRARTRSSRSRPPIYCASRRRGYSTR
ncbi:MAG: acyl-CoA/acyl-ACP dehydrogenase [Betaproteobacteria bacterium]|nr:acyl-CoA/acyl-ACP dehydrogenase [Betaproteobacteria bacterium]